MMKERDVLTLLITKGLGPKGIGRIMRRVLDQDSQVDLSLMSPEEIIEHMGVKPDIAEQISASVSKADELLKKFEIEDIKILIKGRDGYPERLLKTLKEEAPLLLFARGNISLLAEKAVGFCGSRKASEKGLAVARECAAELARRRINVVSGYAHGVDIAAHKAALEAGGVTTFVLAEGILHFRIKSDVKNLLTADNYVVISEYMPRLPWLARNAMHRNKTICGLSNAVVVIESGLKGGTFEAGKTALSLRRPLFVVEYAQRAESAEGNDYFLKQGARFLRKKNGAAYLEELFHAVEKDEANVPQSYEHKNVVLAEKAGDEVEQLSVWELPGVYSSAEKSEQEKDKK